jgi:hypothetical protein
MVAVTVGKGVSRKVQCRIEIHSSLTEMTDSKKNDQGSAA